LLTIGSIEHPIKRLVEIPTPYSFIEVNGPKQSEESTPSTTPPRSIQLDKERGSVECIVQLRHILCSPQSHWVVRHSDSSRFHWNCIVYTTAADY
jgi:hypothetical protein